jgi:hypothetical protein
MPKVVWNLSKCAVKQNSIINLTALILNFCGESANYLTAGINKRGLNEQTKFRIIKTL